MVNTIWFRFDLIRFRKDFSVCIGDTGITRIYESNGNCLQGFNRIGSSVLYETNIETWKQFTRHGHRTRASWLQVRKKFRQAVLGLGNTKKYWNGWVVPFFSVLATGFISYFTYRLFIIKIIKLSLRSYSVKLERNRKYISIKYNSIYFYKIYFYIYISTYKPCLFRNI